MSTNAKLFPLLSGIVILSLFSIAYYVFDVVIGYSREAPETVQLSTLKQLGLALQQYAIDHGGKFPEHISDVQVGSLPVELRQFRDPGNGETHDWAYMRQFHDPATGETHDWLYFSGRTTDDPEGTILATSPVETFHEGGVVITHRIVVFVDDSARIMPEADFEKVLSAQQKSGALPALTKQNKIRPSSPAPLCPNPAVKSPIP